jgi:hypothetical protein
MMMCVYPEGADLNRGTITKVNRHTGEVRVLQYDDYTHPGVKVIRSVFIPPGASPGVIVKRIISAKPADKKLTILKLVAHGDAGMLFLSGPVPAVPLTQFTVDEFADLRPHFDSLRGVIHLHGCGVASDTSIVVGGTIENPITIPGTWKGSSEGLTYEKAPGSKRGYRLMSKLAQVTGISVVAALNVQPYLATNFKGETVWVYPNGYAVPSW